MQYVSDEQLNDMFQSLDLRQLEELGYVIDSQSPDHLEDFLITIEEEFSDLDRNEKIAELKKVGLDEVQFDAETMGPAGGYLGGFSGSHDGVDYKVSFNCSHDLNSRDSYYESEMRNYVEAQISNGYDSGSEPFVLTDERSGKQMKGTVTWESIETLDAETKRQRMKREKEEAAMDEASTDVDYMREHYSESDAYIYAYNDGHRDGRDTSHKINYQPSATDRELTSFKKIFKQAEFAADSPFNTLLLIREDIIIDDEEDFDRLLSIYMSLETDIAQLYQETSNPKHPLLGEMMRYRNRIANRLDELQEEVAIQDTIEMDAEQQRMSVPFTLEQPLRTGYKLGLGWVAAALTIPLAMLGIGAIYNQE